MKYFLLLLFPSFLGLPAFSQTDSTALVTEAINFQTKLNKEFDDPEESPLSEQDRKEFTELEFFPVNLDYRVNAKIKRVKKEKVFKMETTTDRETEYVKFAEAEFSLLSKTYKLNIYQNVALRKQDKYKNYLFLPFTDLTNGDETYGGGRYIDLEIPEDDEIIIDFNKAYNPYCAYNHKYSCPVPPKENFLSLKVLAGVKAYNH